VFSVNIFFRSPYIWGLKPEKALPPGRTVLCIQSKTITYFPPDGKAKCSDPSVKNL
jgi:hypothetical protein